VNGTQGDRPADVVQQPAQITQPRLAAERVRKLPRPERARQGMAPKTPRLAVLSVDVQHFPLQGQGKSNVGDLIEAEPRDGMLQ
jgi:hypothetical protein